MSKFTAEQKIQRAYDVIQIKNLMARHAFYHASSRHELEMEKCWAHNAPNASWGNHMGFEIGRDTVYGFYAEPHIGRTCEPGMLFMHTLTTPLVEVAEDGQTAQAMWYTPGFGIAHGSGNWMYERYAIDFIREDGEWKIWHFFVGMDFGFEAGTAYEKRKGGGGPPPSEEAKPEPGVLRIKNFYTSDYGWAQYPPVPEPYGTYSEAAGYGPEAYME